MNQPIDPRVRTSNHKPGTHRPGCSADHSPELTICAEPKPRALASLYAAELELLDRYKAATGATVDSVTRLSSRRFDFEFRGREPLGSTDTSVAYSAWMPLAAIRELTSWPALADETDYPDMVASGDWSGVRDSSRRTIWRIFSMHVVPRSTFRVPEKDPAAEGAAAAKRDNESAAEPVIVTRVIVSVQLVATNGRTYSGAIEHAVGDHDDFAVLAGRLATQAADMTAEEIPEPEGQDDDDLPPCMACGAPDDHGGSCAK